MKVLLRIAILMIACGEILAGTLFDQEISGIRQYGADGLTVIYLKNDFVSPNECNGGPWGNKAVLLRTSEPNSERILSVALAAQMAGRKVDVAVKNSCDANTESLHSILIK